MSLTDVTWVREKPVDAAEEIDHLRRALGAARRALADAEVVIDADDQPEVWNRVHFALKGADHALKVHG